MTSITFGCVVEISNYSGQWTYKQTNRTGGNLGLKHRVWRLMKWDDSGIIIAFTLGFLTVNVQLDTWNRTWGWDFPMTWYLFVRRLYPKGLHNIYKHHQTSTKQHVEIIQHLQNKTYMASSRFSTLGSSKIYLQQQKKVWADSKSIESSMKVKIIVKWTHTNEY